MNIFEDLVEELKEENLLEETVKTSKKDTNNVETVAEKDVIEAEPVNAEESAEETIQEQNSVGEESNLGEDEVVIELSNDSIMVEESSDEECEVEDLVNSEEVSAAEMKMDPDVDVAAVENVVDEAVSDVEKPEEMESDAVVEEGPVVNELAAALEKRLAEAEERESRGESADVPKEEVEEKASPPRAEEKPEVTKEADEAVEIDDEEEKEIYRQRVMDRVTSLQMVDHIYSGVEREQMRAKPDPFDHIPVKKALHKFFEAYEELDSPETTSEETALIQQVEKWHSALLQRDAKISAKDLRIYCESANPALSSKAIMALVRFYRNSPFSEPVRSKFDLSVTRLFTKDSKNNLREMVFGRDELIAHLKELYADWSSTPLYEEDEENSEIVLAAFKFQDYISEAKKVKKFDELIKNGFFKRIKRFKKKQQENFFAPLLVAAAIESNVAIGNRYIELIAEERKDQDLTRLEDKYGELHDQAISDATSKTLELAELLHDKKDTETDEETKTAGKLSGLFSNKKILIPIIGLILLALISLVAWGALSGGEPTKSGDDASESVGEKFDLENSSFNHYLKEAYIRQDTLFATAKPSWKELSYDEKESALRKMHLAGSDRGYTKVQLMNGENESIGFANNSGVNVLE